MTVARIVLMLLVVVLAPACTAGSVEDQPGLDEAHIDEIVDVDGALTSFDNPYGDGRANPTSGGAARVVEIKYSPWGATFVKLQVDGVTANRNFGSHVHKTACGDNKGGGHYQDVGGTDVSLANPDNEVWLDFATDGAGSGEGWSLNMFHIRRGEALSVVIHDQLTDNAGKAGPKLACLDVPF